MWQQEYPILLEINKNHYFKWIFLFILLLLVLCYINHADFWLSKRLSSTLTQFSILVINIFSRKWRQNREYLEMTSVEKKSFRNQNYYYFFFFTFSSLGTFSDGRWRMRITGCWWRRRRSGFVTNKANKKVENKVPFVLKIKWILILVI